MEIKEAKYLISSPSVDKCPKPDRPEYAFIGRSNVGKSSLINMLCHKKNLAKVSATPGKTQLINHYEIKSMTNSVSSAKNRVQHWYLVDLPGYGFAVRSQQQRKNWAKMIEDYIRKRENLVNLFILIDSRHEPQKTDISFINRLGEWRIPFAIIFTKADKNKPGATVRRVNAFLEELSHSWEELPAHFITSANERTGRKDLLLYLEKLNK